MVAVARLACVVSVLLLASCLGSSGAHSVQVLAANDRASSARLEVRIDDAEPVSVNLTPAGSISPLVVVGNYSLTGDVLVKVRDLESNLTYQAQVAISKGGYILIHVSSRGISVTMEEQLPVRR